MLFKKSNIENYKSFIKEIVFNEKISDEILKQIDKFNKEGKIILDGYNLYAKIKNGKDFLELKYVNNCFLCNYSDWDFAKFITISVKGLKNKNIKLERKEKVEYVCKDNKSNLIKKTEEEQIYNADKKLAYESRLICNYNYDTYNNAIKYVDNYCFENCFNLNKKWYISNGSIINYNLSKLFMNEKSQIQERYSICPEVYSDEFTTNYIFIDLDENLFKSFMTGSITIDELLEKIDKKEFEKMLIKNNNHIDIV